MSEMTNTINYIEFSATDVAKAKLFYEIVFGWSFVDYGPDYTSFDNNTAGINGGFYTAGGSIVVPTFEFPGGRRFHFDDSVGNVLAVWSE
jgi:hypothetical protein